MFTVIGCLSFFASLFMHIVLWRQKTPRNDVLLLVIVFLAVPAGAYIFVGLFYTMLQGDIFYEYIVSAISPFIMHTALSLAYISSYPAVQATSPSLDILLLIARSREGRMPAKDIVEQYQACNLVGDRFYELVDYGFIQQNGNFYYLAPQAIFIVRLFACYRRFLGLPDAEG